MNARTTIDKAGRVVIPKPLRDALQLRPGDPIEISGAGGLITLRPAPAPVALAKEMGVWVFRSGQPVGWESTRRLLEDLREERLGELSR